MCVYSRPTQMMINDAADSNILFYTVMISYKFMENIIQNCLLTIYDMYNGVAAH